MKLVIAEKPSVASSIAKVIGSNKKCNGYFEGGDYIVSWCVGHLVELAFANAYDPKYEKWNLSDLPIIPNQYKTVVSSGTKKQFNIVKSLLNDSKVNEVICATDAGREGELIFRLLYDKVNCKKPIKRLWISSLEDESISNGFKNLKPGEDYDNLYISAFARAKADWLIGINATRFYSLKYRDYLNSLISVGRVMTPTLSMIVERTNNVKNFKPQEFYVIFSKIQDLVVESDRYETKDEAFKEINNLKVNKMKCVKSNVIEKKTRSPLPYDLTTLQREANRYYGLTSKKTLDITQKLYENKQVTYPRTDSRYVTEDMINSVLDLANKIDKQDYNVDKIVNNAKVNDHHAIIPTLNSLSSNNRTEEENKIYNLIKMRFISSMLKDGVDIKGSYEFKVDDLILKANQSSIKELGFREYENNFFQKKIEASNFILINEGEEFEFLPQIKTGMTSPPKYYTEDTLLSAMERAGNEDLDENLDTEKEGIGTPATRASIIEKLIKLNYIERNKKNLISTEVGENIDKLLPDFIKSPKLTADWENKLTLIADGRLSEREFMEEIENLINKILSNQKEVEFKMEEKAIGKCTRCKEGNIVLRGKAYVCDNDCGWKIYKDNIWWNKKGKKLTDEILKEILEKGEVRIEGFKSAKTGSHYPANISLEDTGQYINFKMRFD
ncbi:DNA topoisomerase 3 [uncultured Ezakiella sp.]|uniref:DNA topoisomerase 3 n=1 Tax=uncultured Ezakiella sp. TaxID=1637529 RepID=UPI0025CEADBC|nr:DNA topoisomerase 3 [uncultured Ezakiella sp.]